MADGIAPPQLDQTALTAIAEIVAARMTNQSRVRPEDVDVVTWSDRLSADNHGLTINALVWGTLGAYGARVVGEAQWEHVIDALSQAASALGFASIPALIVGVWGVIRARPISRVIAARRKGGAHD